MTFSTLHSGLMLGVTLGIDSGMSIVTTCVGDPSQPCGTEKVTTV